MNIRYYFVVPKIYPIFCLTVSLILGIWWQSYEPHWLLSVGAAFALASGLMIFSAKLIAAKPMYIFFYLGAFFFGCFNYHRVIVAQQTFCTYTNGKCFDITGTIVDINQTANPYLRYAIKLNIKKIISATDPHVTYPETENICLYAQSLNNLRVADTILIRNLQFKAPKNPEFMRFLLKENMVTSAPMTHSTIELIDRPIFSWSRTIAEYKSKLLRSFRKSMDKETFLAFSSIFLGNPVAKKKEDTLKNQLKIWGLFHYIARAGLHLVIFVSIWMFILSLLPVSWSIRQCLIILLCGLYFILTWPSIPFNRAFFTLLFVRICGLLRLKTYYIPSLALIAFITLAVNPIALFALDFQLSFGVTYALAWLNEIRAQRH